MCCQKTDLSFPNSILMSVNGISSFQISLKMFINYQVLNDTFTMDYKRELRFQQIPDENEGASKEPPTIAIPETDAVIKGSFLITFCSFNITVLL